MKIKIILFNLCIIIFLICLIYLYIYVNYKYEGFDVPVAKSPGEVFRQDGVRENPITDKTTESNVLNERDTIAKINPTLAELEKVGANQETAISTRVMSYFNIGRAANNKPALPDGYYWVDFNDTNLTGALTSYTGATLNPIEGSTDQYLLYNSSGSLMLREDYVCDILVVGGGGAGSVGGGGAGQVVYKTNQKLKAGIYSIIVGNGGIGDVVTKRGNDGNDSYIQLNGTDVIRARKGGGGAPNGGVLATAPNGIYGSTGGNGADSRGGQNYFPTGTVLDNIGAVSTTRPGFAGYESAGGGGGAGQPGQIGINGNYYDANNGALGGAGGNGIQINITGTNTYYGGGGAGGTNINRAWNTQQNRSKGGLGGGGDGNRIDREAGLNGAPNTGGGGGGSDWEYSGASGSGGSGVVIIRFKERASLGKKYLYCLMNKDYFGGGWMLAMRAVRGSKTFGYNSEHWTTATTLNDTIEKIRDASYDADLNVSSIGDAIFNNYEGNTGAINRYDAKFDIFNRYKANEWMAIFYFKNNNGVVLKGGDSISGGGNRTSKGWIWRETNIIESDKIERTPLQLFQKRNSLDRYSSLIDLRGNYGVRNVKELEKFKPVANMPQLWSSQHGYNFYGINYDVPEWYEGWNARGSSTRWGFAWNENWDYSNNNYTNDVYGGIGLRFPGAGQPGYSAGDFIYCCHDSVGANSSIAFEWYVR